jgi:hypothetical protein
LIILAMSAKDRSLRRWKRIRRICCRIDVAALRLMAGEKVGREPLNSGCPRGTISHMELRDVFAATRSRRR